MKLEFWGINKTKNSFFQESEAFYLNRLKHYFKLELKYFPPAKNHQVLSPSDLKKAEAEIFLKNLKNADHLVLLDEKGKNYSSREFANLIQGFANRSIQKLVFVSGGAYGFDQQIYDRANNKISLSTLTFSHQLVRTIFLEQLYRAGTINKGEAYHND